MIDESNQVFEMLIKTAISMGATDASIISTGEIPVEKSVVEMCESPRCEGYGQCANCPPHVMGPDEAIEWIRSYNKALVFRLDLAPEALLHDDYQRTFHKIFAISAAMEGIASRKGIINASGLGAGSCKPVFCPKQPCAVLEGGQCRYPHLARPSLEALGINVFKLAEKLGWKIHRFLRDTDPKSIPYAMLVGLVLFDRKVINRPGSYVPKT